MIEKKISYYKGSNEFLISKKNVIQILRDTIDLLFPGYFNSLSSEALNASIFFKERIYNNLILELNKIVKNKSLDLNSKQIALEFIHEIQELIEILKSDLEATFNGDPAAIDYDEIIITYPGFLATIVYRIANILYKKNVPYIPRIMSEYAHSKTGIDIHPGATIGPYFFIDHGTGIVIGETAIIGKNAKIYQNVTIGALSLGRGQALKGVKRHPTILDNVTIYAGATILGGDTIINNNVTIGANTFITSDVPENTIALMKASDIEFISKKTADS